MRRKWYVIALLFLLIVASVLTTVRKENSRCGIEALAVDEKWMPEGWQNDDAFAFGLLLKQDRAGARQALHVPMNNGHSTAFHTVYQYSNGWLAVFHLWLHRETFLPSASWEWSELEGSRNLPLHADWWQVKCGAGPFSLLGNRCAAVVRYGAYVSRFSSSIQEDVMSTEEFEEIVLEIDELFSSCEE